MVSTRTSLQEDIISPFFFFLLAVQNAVKTSLSRPPSKPRVRNPLALLKSHSQGQGISPPPLSSSGCPPIPNISYHAQQNTSGSAATDSPTQLEKDFLASGNGAANSALPSGWVEGSQEEDQFNTLIPEDNTILNSSLTSSLSSICGMVANRDLDSAPDVSFS